MREAAALPHSMSCFRMTSAPCMHLPQNVAPYNDKGFLVAGHGKAYFFTVQIRSADEPATRFYRCASKAVDQDSNCIHSWSENC